MTERSTPHTSDADDAEGHGRRPAPAPSLGAEVGDVDDVEGHGRRPAPAPALGAEVGDADDVEGHAYVARDERTLLGDIPAAAKDARCRSGR